MSGLVSEAESLVAVLFTPTRYFQPAAQTGTPTSTTTGGIGELLADAGALLFGGSPAVNGLIIPDCAIDERHTDTLTLTRHPVERGARITDHAYKEMPEVRLRWSWSNSATANLFGGESYARSMYEAILTLQVSGYPFTLSTGKRLYNNMMITQIITETNVDTEYSAPLEIVCSEIIIVDTQAATIPSQDVAAQPQQTAPVQTQGQQQATPSAQPPSSLLYRMTGTVST